MKFSVVIFGEEKVAAKFDRMAKDMEDARPAFEKVAEYLMEITETQFDSQGRRGGGSWKFLTPAWLRYKQLKGYDTRILHKFGILRRSVTRQHAEGQVLHIKKEEIEFGSELEYAARHQFGYAQTPARPYLKILRSDEKKITDIVAKHIMRAWRKGV